MIKKVLIANRGEIAVRIIQACQELGISTVAIFSEADRDSLHVKLADETYCIGPAPATKSYLNYEEILKVAILADVDAIHPGYGFLSEDTRFATLCKEFNIIFVGPRPETIQQMGIKDVARKTMKNANIPITPGSDGIIKSVDEAKDIAHQIGFPVMIKATAGGGGRGMNIVKKEADLKKLFLKTQRESEAIFNNPDVYIEKYINNFRHIEVQILSDSYGNTIHLGERDCTVQRRMQKLIEETPSPAITEKTREKMGEVAVKVAKAVNYIGAGTVEFIYDQCNDKFYFMEMNTRIQVEHPITELVTGIDLVKEQLKIASGQKLSINQSDVNLNGWAIECRINAENPYDGFKPSPGKITKYIAPSGLGVRIDSAVYSNYTIPTFYDSLISKLIVHGKNRKDAMSKMNRALNHYKIEGVKTTIPYLTEIINHQTFISGKFNTNFIEQL